uniref:Non-structural polyprotein n=1 Tax=Crocidura shantungensis dicistrovirus 1 TaxID=3139513 RepID=A0AB38ZJZ0_9VIRU
MDNLCFNLSADTFGMTLANSYGSHANAFYTYRCIDEMIFSDLYCPYIFEVNNRRKLDLMSPLKRWFDIYSPCQVSHGRSINQAFALHVPQRSMNANPFIDGYPELEVFHQTFFERFNLECNSFNLDLEEKMEYSFLIGLSSEDQEYYLSMILDDNFDNYNLSRLILDLQESRTMPVLLWDGKWVWQQPHLALSNFMDQFSCYDLKFKNRLFTFMERQSRKYLFPHDSTVCLCSDGFIYEEKAHYVAMTPHHNLTLESGENAIVSFVLKYKTEIESLCSLQVQAWNDVNVRISNTDVDLLLERVMSSFNSVLKGVQNALYDCFVYFIKIVVLLLLVKAALKLCEGCSMNSLLRLFGTFCVGAATISYVSRCMKPQLVCQAGDNESLSTFFSLITLEKIFKFRFPLNVKQSKDFVWFVSQAPRFKQGSDFIIDSLKEIYSFCEDFFRTRVLGMPSLSSESPAAKWLGEVDVIVKKYKGQRLRLDSASFDKMYSLWKQGSDFLCNSLYKEDFARINKYMNLIFNLMEKVPRSVRNGHLGSLRPPPATILLSGATGVGKSTVTFPLAVEIASRIMALEGDLSEVSDEDIVKSIYARSSEQEFWDGYDNQLITVYDDFMQRYDSAQAPNLELFEVIRASNAFPYPLHMAKLEDKEDTYFSSSVLIATTNLKPEVISQKIHSLNYPGALLRRFDAVIQVDLVSEEEKPTPGMAFNKNLYVFTKYKFVYDKSDDCIITKEKVSYDDIVEMCVASHFKSKATCKSVHENMTDIVKSIRSEMLPTPRPRTSLATQGWLGWNWDHADSDSEEDEPTISYATATEEVEIASEALEMVVEGSDIESLQSHWKKKWDLLVSDYPIIPHLGMVALGVAALSVSFLIYRLFRSDTKEQVVTGGSQYNLPPIVVESNEKQSVAPVVRVENVISKTESNESQSKVPTMKLESQTPRTVLEAAGICMENSVDKVNIQGGTVSIKEHVDAVEANLRTEGVADQNAAEVLSNLVCRNLYALYVEREDSTVRLGHIIMLRERIGMIPQHFLYFLASELKRSARSKIVMRSVFLRNNSYSFFISDFLNFKCYVPPNEEGDKLVDTCLIEMLPINNHPNILSHFVSKNEVGQLTRSDVCLPIIQIPTSEKYEPFATMCVGTGNCALARSGSVSSAKQDGKIFFFRQSWKYRLQTQPGACGAPCVLVGQKQGSGRICGMHVMGDNDGYGYSTNITREMIEEWILKLKPTFVLSEEKAKALQAGVAFDMPFPGHFVPLGKAPVRVTSASKTQLKHSLLYGEISAVLKKPCWLGPGIFEGQPWDPRIYRLEKFGSDRVTVPIETLTLIVDRFVHRVKCIESRDNVNLANFKSRYTFEEACQGIDGEASFNSIKRSTSCGYPWSARFKKGKSEVFGREGPFSFDSPQALEVRSAVDAAERNAEHGVCGLHVFVDTLKDERKPIEKAHKTRMFSASPVDYLILCRMYFQGGVTRLVKTRISNNVAVGVNVYSCEWTVLAQHLLKNKKFVAGDFEGFDASQEREILRAAAEIIVRLCDDERLPEEVRKLHRKVRLVLLESLLESVHYSFDCLYAWSKALPSGHFLTAIINSLFVNIVLCLAFINTCSLSVSESIKTFFDEFSLITYGDDHVIGVPDAHVDRFNQQTLPELLRPIGMKYTMEEKDRVVDAPFRRIDEVSFIKRKFSYNATMDRWFAPLDMESILDCLNWQKSGTDGPLNISVNVEWALRELSLHPESQWEHYFPLIRAACERHGVEVAYLNRLSAFEAVLSSEERLYDS